MQIESLTDASLESLTQLVLQLWPDCDYTEEYDHYKDLIRKENEACYLAKEQDRYIAFIHLSLRTDYIEGATSNPVAYAEGLYVMPEYRQRSIGRQLLWVGQKWAKQKGCREFASDAQLDNQESIKFHSRVGFKETNRIVCFIKEIE
jgi:aminoglycoside 6'-N-acetyltransferase I